MDRASTEEIREYWSLQRKLDQCQECPRRFEYWHIPTPSYPMAVYREDVILNLCPKKEVKHAVQRMKEMKVGRPLGYFNLRGLAKSSRNVKRGKNDDDWDLIWREMIPL